MFSITEPSYPNAALGIESNEISAVALSGNRGAYSIKQAASVQIAPGVLVPSFIDTNIQDHTAFASTLSETVEAAGLLSQKRWSVALPSSTARTAIITLESEPASSKELDEILDWKAEQSFGTPALELRVATTRISPDKDGRSRFFVTAVKLTVIDEYESHFESRGWKAGLIMPRAVGEANWLMSAKGGDSMLISETSDGFTAMLLRGQEPAVVRSVICAPAEVEDEIYRLVMFYNDRVAGGAGVLDRVLVLGNDMDIAKVEAIATEALGREVYVMSPADAGLALRDTGLNFRDLAAPAGLAALGA
jgi:Tfp pilus assembly PilM family ATPase